MEQIGRIAGTLVAAVVLVAACGSGDEGQATVRTEPVTATTTPTSTSVRPTTTSAPETAETTVASSTTAPSTVTNVPDTAETTVASSTTAPPSVTNVPDTAETSAASSTMAPSTATTLPGSEPVLLESIQYPYALTVPADKISRGLAISATSAWDGSEQVIRGTSFLDVFSFSDGVVHVLGTEWTDDLESLAQTFVANSERYNGCSQAKNEREVTVGGAPALVFTVDSCGLGGENLTFVRLVALHDRFGLIAFTETAQGDEPADIDRLTAYFSDLDWRTG